MIKEKAVKQVNNLKPMFLIIGAKHDGYRGLPIQYDLVELVAYSLKELNKMAENLLDFKVYNIGEQYKTKEKILNDIEFIKNGVETLKEFEQYQKLKEKFEK